MGILLTHLAYLLLKTPLVYLQMQSLTMKKKCMRLQPQNGKPFMINNHLNQLTFGLDIKLHIDARIY